MLFLIIGFILSFAGITKEVLEKSTENRENNEPKKRVFLFWGTALTFLGAIFTFWSGCDAKLSQERSDADHNIAYKKLQDSFYQELAVKIDSNGQSNIRTFTQALAEYNLAYKDGQVSFKLFIRDSINQDHPGLLINIGGAVKYVTPRKDSVVLKLPLINTGNCTLRVTASISVGVIHRGKFEFLEKYNFLKDYQLAQFQNYIYDARMITDGTIPERVLYFIKGNCASVTQNKKLNLKEVFVWTLDDNEIGPPSNPKLTDSFQRLFK